jgi:tripartite-type tricarboxylate transporter receptor subunit TctC
MLRNLVLGICMLLGSAAASAQTWPDRPVRVVVAFPPGGGSDTVARVLAHRLGETFSQRFFVENKPGASGMIGAQLVAKAEPDGYTLLVGSPAEIALNQSLFADMTYDPEKDLAPVTLLAWTPLALAAHPSVAASNVAEFLKLAQEQQVDFSTPGIGSAMHLTGEYINKLSAGRLVHVPIAAGLRRLPTPSAAM